MTLNLNMIINKTSTLSVVDVWSVSPLYWKHWCLFNVVMTTGAVSDEVNLLDDESR